MFSVVTAAYNAGPWIDAFFGSIVGQSLGFAGSIEIIVVDDGSTDDTLAKARVWEAKFPGSVTVLTQPNAGPAAARNAGLPLARGEWITTIDPDDFVAPDYFAAVARLIASPEGADVAAVACNMVYFDEGPGTVRDAHPLRFKFAGGVRVVDLRTSPEFVQASTATAFWRRAVIESAGLRYNPRIRPSGEDTDFACRYLLAAPVPTLGLVPEALYFYRKRAQAGSLIDACWRNPAIFRDQILHGPVELVRHCLGLLGKVPAYIQNAIIYQSCWYVRKFLDASLPVPPQPAALAAYLDMMRLVFRHLDPAVVLGTALPMVGLDVRLAMLEAFAGSDLAGFPLVAQELSPDMAELAVSIFGPGAPPPALVLPDGGSRAPEHVRVMAHDYAGTRLLTETRCWFRLPPGNAPLRFTAAGRDVAVLCGSEGFDRPTLDQLRAALYRPLSQLPPQIAALARAAAAPAEADRYAGCWLFMDRVHKADDNAEHLYRFVRSLPPGSGAPRRAYFVLSRQSADWGRLAAEGFDLLPHGSRAHHLALFQAAWIVSSHIDPPVVDPLGIRDSFGYPKYKAAFLQHGVITADLSRWLNGKRLDLFVTTAPDEYASVISGGYKFSPREVVHTGLPRHDALLAKAAAKRPGRFILVSPTWRKHLRQTEAHIPGLPPDEAAAFAASDYFAGWNAVLSDPGLADVCAGAGCRLLFLPHPEISRFLPLFTLSRAVGTLAWSDLKGSVQDLLAGCCLLITDYSSLAAEVAVAGRPVIYHRFPEDPPVYASHVYSAGYFDAAVHGFGPVTTDLPALVAAVAGLAAAGFVRPQPYQSRAAAFFPHRDGRNCRRVFEAILARTPAAEELRP